MSLNDEIFIARIETVLDRKLSADEVFEALKNRADIERDLRPGREINLIMRDRKLSAEAFDKVMRDHERKQHENESKKFWERWGQ